jgi:hypothetical protein
MAAWMPRSAIAAASAAPSRHDRRNESLRCVYRYKYVIINPTKTFR